jgi:hypothetical protein
MKHLGTWVVLGGTLALSGCAAGLVGSADSGGEVRLLTDTVASPPRVVLAVELAPETTEQPPSAADHDVTLIERNESPPQAPTTAIQLTAEDAQPDDSESMVVDAPPAVAKPTASDAPPPSVESTFPDAPPLVNEPAFTEAVASDGLPEIPNQNTPPAPIDARGIEVAQTPTVTRQDSPLAPNDAEQIVTPGQIPPSPFRPGTAESDQDRFTRRVVDVPVDIRPTEGTMPEDLAAAKIAGEPTIDETFPSDLPPDVFCSHAPWTFCYRPLYFEDIKLERYGANIGYAQTGLSGVRFFGSILALPYKMTVRPPRSCQCSNGFSRCGDCPLPGYGRREFRIDASLIEAAAVTGVVYILP